jgi:hypothetical protein
MPTATAALQHGQTRQQARLCSGINRLTKGSHHNDVGHAHPRKLVLAQVPHKAQVDGRHGRSRQVTNGNRPRQGKDTIRLVGDRAREPAALSGLPVFVVVNVVAVVADRSRGLAKRHVQAVQPLGPLNHLGRNTLFLIEQQALIHGPSRGQAECHFAAESTDWWQLTLAEPVISWKAQRQPMGSSLSAQLADAGIDAFEDAALTARKALPPLPAVPFSLSQRHLNPRFAPPVTVGSTISLVCSFQQGKATTPFVLAGDGLGINTTPFLSAPWRSPGSGSFVIEAAIPAARASSLPDPLVRDDLVKFESKASKARDEDDDADDADDDLDDSASLPSVSDDDGWTAASSHIGDDMDGEQDALRALSVRASGRRGWSDGSIAVLLHAAERSRWLPSGFVGDSGKSGTRSVLSALMSDSASLARLVALASARRVDPSLEQLARWPKLLALAMESYPGGGITALREDSLRRMMQATLREASGVLSMAVAFEPGVFVEEHGQPPSDAYCLFVMKTPSGDIESAYLLPPPRGAYEPLYREWSWYALPRRMNRGMWSEPYVDEGGGGVAMITYSAPLRANGVFVGIVTCDVQLDPSSSVDVPRLAAGPPKGEDLWQAELFRSARKAMRDATRKSEEAALRKIQARSAMHRGATTAGCCIVPASSGRTSAALATMDKRSVTPLEAQAAIQGLIDPVRRLALRLSEAFGKKEAESLALVASAQGGTLPESSAADPLTFGAIGERDTTWLHAELKGVVNNNPLAFGCCLAFAPNTFEGSSGPAPRCSMYICRDLDAATPRLSDVVALQYDYTSPKFDWFRKPYTTGLECWSKPYFDAGGGDAFMVTYSAPVLSPTGLVLAVVTVDVLFSEHTQTLMRLSKHAGGSESADTADADDEGGSAACAVCRLPCSAWWMELSGQEVKRVCGRCASLGLVPPLDLSASAATMPPTHGAGHSTLVSATPKWSLRWTDRSIGQKQTGDSLRFGDCVQLRHVRSGRLLRVDVLAVPERDAGKSADAATARLEWELSSALGDGVMGGTVSTAILGDESGRAKAGVFVVELSDLTTGDPYMEGDESTWFVVERPTAVSGGGKPLTDAHTVHAGAPVQLRSAKWGCVLEFHKDIPTIKAAAPLVEGGELLSPEAVLSTPASAPVLVGSKSNRSLVKPEPEPEAKTTGPSARLRPGTRAKEESDKPALSNRALHRLALWLQRARLRLAYMSDTRIVSHTHISRRVARIQDDSSSSSSSSSSSDDDEDDEEEDVVPPTEGEDADASGEDVHKTTELRMVVESPGPANALPVPAVVQVRSPLVGAHVCGGDGIQLQLASTEEASGLLMAEREVRNGPNLVGMTQIGILPGDHKPLITSPGPSTVLPRVQGLVGSTVWTLQPVAGSRTRVLKLPLPVPPEQGGLVPPWSRRRPRNDFPKACLLFHQGTRRYLGVSRAWVVKHKGRMTASPTGGLELMGSASEMRPAIIPLSLVERPELALPLVLRDPSSPRRRPVQFGRHQDGFMLSLADTQDWVLALGEAVDPSRVAAEATQQRLVLTQGLSKAVRFHAWPVPQPFVRALQECVVARDAVEDAQRLISLAGAIQEALQAVEEPDATDLVAAAHSEAPKRERRTSTASLAAPHASSPSGGVVPEGNTSRLKSIHLMRIAQAVMVNTPIASRSVVSLLHARQAAIERARQLNPGTPLSLTAQSSDFDELRLLEGVLLSLRFVSGNSSAPMARIRALVDAVATRAHMISHPSKPSGSSSSQRGSVRGFSNMSFHDLHSVGASSFKRMARQGLEASPWKTDPWLAAAMPLANRGSSSRSTGEEAWVCAGASGRASLWANAHGLELSLGIVEQALTSQRALRDRGEVASAKELATHMILSRAAAVALHTVAIAVAVSHEVTEAAKQSLPILLQLAAQGDAVLSPVAAATCAAILDQRPNAADLVPLSIVDALCDTLSCAVRPPAAITNLLSRLVARPVLPRSPLGAVAAATSGSSLSPGDPSASVSDSLSLALQDNAPLTPSVAIQWRITQRLLLAPVVTEDMPLRTAVAVLAADAGERPPPLVLRISNMEAAHSTVSFRHPWVADVLHPASSMWQEVDPEEAASAGALELDTADEATVGHRLVKGEEAACSLRLLWRLCMGAGGEAARRVVLHPKLGGVSANRLIRLVSRRDLSSDLFAAQAQCMHLLRVLFVDSGRSSSDNPGWSSTSTGSRIPRIIGGGLSCLVGPEVAVAYGGAARVPPPKPVAFVQTAPSRTAEGPSPTPSSLEWQPVMADPRLAGPTPLVGLASLPPVMASRVLPSPDPVVPSNLTSALLWMWGCLPLSGAPDCLHAGGLDRGRQSWLSLALERSRLNESIIASITLLASLAHRGCLHTPDLVHLLLSENKRANSAPAIVQLLSKRQIYDAETAGSLSQFADDARLLRHAQRLVCRLICLLADFSSTHRAIEDATSRGTGSDSHPFELHQEIRSTLASLVLRKCGWLPLARAASAAIHRLDQAVHLQATAASASRVIVIADAPMTTFARTCAECVRIVEAFVRPIMTRTNGLPLSADAAAIAGPLTDQLRALRATLASSTADPYKLRDCCLGMGLPQALLVFLRADWAAVIFPKDEAALFRKHHELAFKSARAASRRPRGLLPPPKRRHDRVFHPIRSALNEACRILQSLVEVAAGEGTCHRATLALVGPHTGTLVQGLGPLRVGASQLGAVLARYDAEAALRLGRVPGLIAAAARSALRGGDSLERLEAINLIGSTTIVLEQPGSVRLLPVAQMEAVRALCVVHASGGRDETALVALKHCHLRPDSLAALLRSLDSMSVASLSEPLSARIVLPPGRRTRGASVLDTMSDTDRAATPPWTSLSPRGFGPWASHHDPEPRAGEGGRALAHLLMLLTSLAPNRLRYHKGSAVREHEEAGELVGASLSARGLLSALLTTRSWAAKAVLLRLLDQAYGGVAFSGLCGGAAAPAAAATSAAEAKDDVASLPASMTNVDDIFLESEEEEEDLPAAFLEPAAADVAATIGAEPVAVRVDDRCAPIYAPEGTPLSVLMLRQITQAVFHWLSSDERSEAPFFVFRAALPSIGTTIRLPTADQVRDVKNARVIGECVVAFHNALASLAQFIIRSVENPLRLPTRLDFLCEADIGSLVNALMTVSSASSSSSATATATTTLIPQLRSIARHLRQSPDVDGGALMTMESAHAGVGTPAGEIGNLCREALERGPAALARVVTLCLSDVRAAESSLSRTTGSAWSGVHPSPSTGDALVWTRAGAASAEDSHAAYGCLEALLLSLAVIAKEDRGRSALVEAGCAELTVAVVAQHGTATTTGDSGSASDRIMAAALRLAAALLRGGFKAAQQRMLQAAADNVPNRTGKATVVERAGVSPFCRALSASLSHIDGKSVGDPGVWENARLSLLLVQRLAEGHNRPWQLALVGSQAAASQGRHGQAVSVATDIAELMRRMFKDAGVGWTALTHWTSGMSPQLVAGVLGTAMQAATTLTEIIQGPCREAQRQLLGLPPAREEKEPAWSIGGTAPHGTVPPKAIPPSSSPPPPHRGQSAAAEAVSWLLDGVRCAQAAGGWPYRFQGCLPDRDAQARASASILTDESRWHALLAQWGRLGEAPPSSSKAATRSSVPAVVRSGLSHVSGNRPLWWAEAKDGVHDLSDMKRLVSLSQPPAEGEDGDDEGVEDSVSGRYRAETLIMAQRVAVTLLRALVEGDASDMGEGELTGSLALSLDVRHIPVLIGRLLPRASRQQRVVPLSVELSLGTDSERLSGGVFPPTAELDLACDWLGLLKCMSVSIGLPAELWVTAATGEALGVVANPFEQSTSRPGRTWWPDWWWSGVPEHEVPHALQVVRGAVSCPCAPKPYLGMWLGSDTLAREALARVLGLVTMPQCIRLSGRCGDLVKQVDVVVNRPVVSGDGAGDHHPSLGLTTLVFRVPPSAHRAAKDEAVMSLRRAVIRDTPRDSVDTRVEGFAIASRRALKALLVAPAARRSMLVRASQQIAQLALVLGLLANLLVLLCHSALEEPHRSAACTGLSVVGWITAAVSVLRFFAVEEREGPIHAALGQDDSGVTTRDSSAHHLCRGNCNAGFEALFGLFTNWSILYAAAFCAFAVAAALTGSPALYSVLLVDVVALNRTLTGTLLALKPLLPTLGATGVLWLAALYWFTVLSWGAYQADFPDGECKDLADCFQYVVNFGLRAGGGLGEAMTGVENGNSPATAVRWFGDVAFFVIVSLLLTAVLTGIVIDAFATERDRTTAITADQQSSCFISGVQTSVFERQSRGFLYHRRYEARMWTYYDLVAMLALKDPTELSGIETAVATSIGSGRIDWLPIGRVRLATEATSQVAEQAKSE